MNIELRGIPRFGFFALVLAALAACGGSYGGSGDGGGGGGTQYSIGGTVTGLAGSGLVLRLNGAHDLTIDADGAFTFASISAYRIDDVSGILTEVPGSPFAAGNNPDFIAIL